MRFGLLVCWWLCVGCSSSTTNPAGSTGGADAGGASGSGGAGGTATSDGSSEAGSNCPDDMIDVGTFCIDALEVTNKQYATWLASTGGAPSQAPPCDGNQTLAPSESSACSTRDKNDQRPVSCIDWCDAKAYCKDQGKRMCGARGGGGNFDPKKAGDAEFSEWFAACSQGGKTTFPYGDTFKAQACVDQESSSGPLNVGSAIDCRGQASPYDELFDMSGNVAEWDDSCLGSVDMSDPCLTRGGSFAESGTTPALLSCAGESDPDSGALLGAFSLRSVTATNIGFRCCVDELP